MKNFKLIALLNLLVVYVVWGSTFLGIKLALEGGMAPFMLIGLRYLVAGSMLYMAVRCSGVRAALASEWRESAVLSFMLLVCGAGLVAWSQKFISSSLAALLVATSPLWVSILDPEQKLNARKWLGLIVGLVGVGSLVGASLTSDNDGFLVGCLGCLASALAWALGSLRARRTTREIAPVAQAGMQMICAGGALLLLAVLLGDTSSLQTVSLKAWMAWFYLTMFGSLLAYSSYTWLVSNTPAALVSTHAYVNPVVAMLLGAVMGGEPLTGPSIGAALVVLVGVVIFMTADFKPRRLVPVPVRFGK